MKRTLGRLGREIAPIGMGCWAIGSDWGAVDEAEAVRAIRVALDLGAELFDTSNAYGAGRSERLLARGLEGHRPGVLVATKFGYVTDPKTGRIVGQDASPSAIRASLEQSLSDLETDYVDLFQFHLGDYRLEQVDDVLATLESLVTEGKIRSFGWSTDDPERALRFALHAGCAAAQFQLNVFDDAPAMLAACETQGLAGLCRSPLAMGLLSGKYSAASEFPENDVRNRSRWWAYFQRDQMPALLARLDGIRDILTSNGRSLVQGALAWVLARSPNTLPIPGFRNCDQVSENLGALRFGPLKADQLTEIEALMGRVVPHQTGDSR